MVLIVTDFQKAFLYMVMPHFSCCIPNGSKIMRQDPHKMVKKTASMLHDFSSWHRKHFYGYINASYRNNRNRKQFINILNRDINSKQ